MKQTWCGKNHNKKEQKKWSDQFYCWNVAYNRGADVSRCTEQCEHCKDMD